MWQYFFQKTWGASPLRAPGTDNNRTLMGLNNLGERRCYDERHEDQHGRKLQILWKKEGYMTDENWKNKLYWINRYCQIILDYLLFKQHEVLLKIIHKCLTQNSTMNCSANLFIQHPHQSNSTSWSRQTPKRIFSLINAQKNYLNFPNDSKKIA